MAVKVTPVSASSKAWKRDLTYALRVRLRPVLSVDDCWEGRRLLKPNFKVHVEERRGGRVRGLRMSESNVRGGSKQQGNVRSRHD